MGYVNPKTLEIFQAWYYSGRMTTWEEREKELALLFAARVRALLDSGVSQAELAERMGGGVTQKDISRWLSGTPKLSPGRFGTAVRALGGDPGAEFAAAVDEAKRRGLFEPGSAKAMSKASTEVTSSPVSFIALARGPEADERFHRDVADYLTAASDARPDESGPDGEDLASEEGDSV